jgi:hypothetical protein
MKPTVSPCSSALSSWPTTVPLQGLNISNSLADAVTVINVSGGNFQNVS